MSNVLTLGISTCPNDTFVFDSWINGRIKGAPLVDCCLKDISELNRMAAAEAADVLKSKGYWIASLNKESVGSFFGLSKYKNRKKMSWLILLDNYRR